MKVWMVACGLAVILSWQNLGLADDGSSRRYLVALESSLEADFFLLLRPDVRNYLGLAQADYPEIVKIITTDFKTDLPLNREWEQWLQSDARKAMTKEELSKKNDEVTGKIDQAVYEQRMKALARILSKDQLETLRNLVFQYRGPWNVVMNPQLKTEFKISDAQVQNITRSMAKLLRKIEDRSLLFIGREGSPYDIGETRVERDTELEAIYKEICALKKERDQTALNAFDAAQKEKWKAACGKLYPIQWDPKLIRFRTADTYLRSVLANEIAP